MLRGALIYLENKSAQQLVVAADVTIGICRQYNFKFFASHNNMRRPFFLLFTFFSMHLTLSRSNSFLVVQVMQGTECSIVPGIHRYTVHCTVEVKGTW